MSISRYRKDMQVNARGFWIGLWNQAEFAELMFESIDIGLTNAWRAGAKQVGIAPDEITPAEQAILASIIFREYSHVAKLTQFIQANSRANGGKLKTVFARLELWVNRYKDVVNRAKVEGEKDPKLKWVLGPSKTHCNTCGRLSGKVKRASWWKDNVMPQQPKNENLECEGWKCQCNLEPTDEPMSRGRMPSVP